MSLNLIFAKKYDIAKNIKKKNKTKNVDIK